jgi:hypothetical protein
MSKHYEVEVHVCACGSQWMWFEPEYEYGCEAAGPQGRDATVVSGG